MISGIDLTLATVAATTTIVAKAITRQVAAHGRLATDLDSSVHRPEGPLSVKLWRLAPLRLRQSWVLTAAYRRRFGESPIETVTGSTRWSVAILRTRRADSHRGCKLRFPPIRSI